MLTSQDSPKHPNPGSYQTVSGRVGVPSVQVTVEVEAGARTGPNKTRCTFDNDSFPGFPPPVLYIVISEFRPCDPGRSAAQTITICVNNGLEFQEEWTDPPNLTVMSLASKVVWFWMPELSLVACVAPHCLSGTSVTNLKLTIHVIHRETIAPPIGATFRLREHLLCMQL